MEFPLFYRVSDERERILQRVIGVFKSTNSQYGSKDDLSEHHFGLVSSDHKEAGFSCFILCHGGGSGGNSPGYYQQSAIFDYQLL